ncbi:bifunctional precorrin-2 dehydrogenase/sirohydrochlorin ferrochelatase, partial [uncultured Spongiibacter sp.]|uniref:precorrin-2 dehydrogenase/sirohydrochlorin ferrochelatase family protein n=1 Tax=uncultured Spongiibacter sp. TaxID=870896 RepID=UPI00259057C0
MDFLPLFTKLDGKTCLLVGGGEVALRKARLLSKAGAILRVVAPDIAPELEQLARESGQCLHADYRLDYLDGVFLVIAATDDQALNEQVSRDCNARNIPTENIRLSQNNIVDPENRYKQIFKIQVELPEDISEKDREGILRSIDRWTVKKVVQTGPEFQIEVVENI